MSEHEKKTANVISLWSRRKGRTFDALAQVEAYWHGLREGGAVPPRSAVDPRGIQDALEYAFILECVAPGIARFRLAGAHLADLMGMEVRGMPILAMFTPAARATLAATTTEVCASTTVTHLTLNAERSIGRPVLNARMILMPLTDDFGDRNRILGCLQSEGRIGRQPRRFDVAGVTRQTGSDTATVQAAQPEPQDAAFSEASGVFVHPSDAKGPDVRPALRVVSNLD